MLALWFPGALPRDALRLSPWNLAALGGRYGPSKGRDGASYDQPWFRPRLGRPGSMRELSIQAA